MISFGVNVLDFRRIELEDAGRRQRRLRLRGDGFVYVAGLPRTGERLKKEKKNYNTRFRFTNKPPGHDR